MALAQKRIVSVDAATVALWRAAESGDVEALAALLPRVANINARNEHGVTALMRAAQDGHVEMVRALLEHGADANIKRHDKFTALALAAFFGHTEVVRVLMEHGADAKASTRNGTSPQMWATARTFNEVVDQLDKPVVRRAPIAAVVRKEAASAPRAPVATGEAAIVHPMPIVVRTLKDPPEIWDLVHEVPRGFNARSAFMTRFRSMQSGFAFRAVAALVLIGMCVVGVMVLRGVQARNERTVAPRPAVVSPPKVTETHTVAPEVVAPTTNDHNDQPATVSKSVSRQRATSSHRVEPRATQVETSEVAQPKVTAASAEKSEAPVRAENTTKAKPTVPLSPQLISPVKSSAPKAKVIQWP